MNFMKKLSVKWQISLMSAFFILISTVSTSSVLYILGEQRLDGQTINIAGRQRMLIQKFAKEVFLYQINEQKGEKTFEKTQQLFTVSLQALMEGGETFTDLGMTVPITIPKVEDTQALEKMAAIEEKWYQLTELAKTNKNEEININANQLLKEMNEVVGLLAQSSRHSTDILIAEIEILLALMVLVGVLLSYIIITAVTRPLKELDELSKDFREGHLDYVVPDKLMNGNNEITSLATSIESMRDNLERLLGSVQASSLEMKNTAQQVSYISKTIIDGAREQDERTERVQTSVESLTEIAEVVKKEIEQSAEFVKKSEQKAKQGIVVARQNITELDTAVEGVSKASDMMQNLSESAEKMHNIVDSIQNIAAQTNLLALNAAIEAARAGEQGRGFAVVADEVRTLASRTSSSTGEITQLIEDFSDRVNESVDSMSALVSQVNTIQEHSQQNIVSFAEMTNDVASTAASNQQILEYNSQQSEQVGQLSEQFGDLFTALTANANKADSTSLVADSLYETAESLRSGVSGYTVRSFANGSVLHDGDEKRQAARVKSNISTKVISETDGTMNAMVEDISSGGCKLILKDEIKEKIVNLSMLIPYADREKFENQKPLELIASIIRKDQFTMDNEELRYLYGLKFSEVNDEQTAKLDEVIVYYKDIRQGEGEKVDSLT